MRKEIFHNAVGVSHLLARLGIDVGAVAVDATVGNGGDTKLLCELVGETGKVYGFDVQPMAIEQTKELLRKENLCHRAVLIEDGHQHLEQYIFEKIDFILFNLGYLPKGDHSITTLADTTKLAVEKALKMLAAKGKLLLVIYPGHEPGLQELLSLVPFCQALNQKEFNVLHMNWMNQSNYPPQIILIEKRK